MRRQIIVMFCGLFLLPLPAAFAEVPSVAQNRGALFRVQDAGHTQIGRASCRERVFLTV